MWALHPPEVGIRLVPRSGYLRPLSLLRRAPPQPSNLRRVEGRPLCGTATLALAITALARGQQRRFRAALRAVDIESLEVVDVLCEEEGPVQIRMRWPKGGESRMFNRPRDQLLDKTLMRMSLTLQKGSNTKAKRRGWRQRKQHKEVEQKKVEPPKTITMSLLTNDGQPLDGSLQLEEAFAAETKAAILLAGEESYRVRINRPMARHVTCRGRPRAGLRLAAVAQGCFCDSQKLRWEWLVGGELVSREHCYTPTEAQVGQALEVIARPPLAADPKTSLLLGVDDLEASAQLELPAVQPQAALPGQCDTRSQAMDAQLQTWLESQDKAPNTLRVVSYNALADCYRHCWDQMFPYCQPETLRPEQRLQLIRQEVSTFRADLLGMQEVDATWYKEYWQPQFAADGFGSCFTKKVSDSLEGCLLVYKEEALELLEIRERPLRDLFRRRVSPPESALEEVTSLPSMDAAIGALVGKLPALDDVFPRLGTVAQLALFRSRKDSSQLLLVCNTHLYFANYARHIRVLQAALLLAEAESMAVSAVEKFGHRPGLLFMGDLNSTPDTAVVELLRRGFVSAGHPDWATCAAFRWGYASSRQAAKDMLAALRSDDRASAFRDLVVDDEGLEALMSLRATTERLMRVRASLATLGLGQASEVAEEEQAEVAEVHEAVSDTAASAWERLEERLQAKGTFKNSAVVATAQLALDLRLSNEPVLEFRLEEDLERVMAATDELTAAVSQKVKNAIETQKALSEAELGSSTGAALAGIGLQLESPFRLLSTYDPAPEFTNFVGNYEACLDWIFFEGDHFHKVSEAAVPPREDLEAETALPSTVFPSDHILLAADFAWQAAAKKRKPSLLHLLAELLERVGRVADLSQLP